MTDDDSDDEDEHEKGPSFKEIPEDKRSEGVGDVDIEDVEEGNDVNDVEPEIPSESDLEANETRAEAPAPQDNWVRRSVRLAREIGLVIKIGPAKMRSTACQLSKGPVLVESLSKRLSDQDCDSARRAIRRELERRSQWCDTEYAFKMSVKAAMRDRPNEALPVIEAELRQMHDKTVWHGVHLRDMTKAQ